MKNAKNSMDFSTILASSVHDMKNSLAMLLGSLNEITNQCEPKTCPVHEKFRRIQHETQRVNRDLVLLLTLYKMDQGKYYLNADEVLVEDYLEEVILEYKELLDGHGITLSLQCPQDLVGYFDRDIVSSVLKTIISNAYQYTQDSITVSAAKVDGFIEINIIDNGPGYPSHMIYDNTIPSTGINFETGNTGLGLYFSQQVANLHKSKDKTGYIQIRNLTKDRKSVV